MNPQCSAVPRPQSNRPFKTFTVSAGGETGASTGSEEAEVEVESAAARAVSTVVALGEVSAGESEAEDETEEKLSFFFKNSSLLLAFLRWVEGLVRFFPRVELTLLSRVSREKEKEELMARMKLKSLPWLASVWQKARH